MSIGYFIATAAAWDERRKEPLRRLTEQLQGAAHAVASPEKEHAREWSQRLYARALASDYDTFVFLNDDDVLPSGFAGLIESVIAAAPDQVISLATICPQAKTHDGPWLRSYLLSGPGYIYPRADLEDRIAFDSRVPAEMWVGHGGWQNEDGIGAMHAWSRQKPIWQTIPALVEHDVTVPSTLGYDAHPGRVSTAPFGYRSMPASWAVTEEPPHVPHPWMTIGQLERGRQACMGNVNDLCVFCRDLTGRQTFTSPTTGARICGYCVADIVGHVMVKARVG